MTIFAESSRMELAFNKILKKDLELVIPFVQELGAYQVTTEVLRERFSEMFDQNYECFGIYRDKILIGVFGLWFMTRHYAGRSCEADHVFINQTDQGKGIGRELVRFIISYAKGKGCDTVELNAYLHNERSHKFYQNHGFEIKGYHFLKKL